MGDANGNMITRTWQGTLQALSYDAENRLVGVEGPITATLGYDGQGNRVARAMADETRLYLGDYFESDPGYTTWVRHYYFGGQRVAMRTPGGLTYLHADHLGSTSETTGVTTTQQLYLPYGSQRTTDVVTGTLRYTGQRWEEAIGLYDYKARYYDPALGRFVQPDSIVPEPGNPQALNRYSYGYNNPLRYTDPSGFDPLDAAWQRQFESDHNRPPDDQDFRDRLFSVIFCGRGYAGGWTAEDWSYYATHRDELWHGAPWSGETVTGLERFAAHIERLATYYRQNETRQFVKAVAFVWGGIPIGKPIPSAWTMATSSATIWAEYWPLEEGVDGWHPFLYEPGQDPAHHYAGSFYMGYFFGATAAIGINHVTNFPGTRRYSAPDILLGDLAALHGANVRSYMLPLAQIGRVIRAALSVDGAQ